MDDLIRRSDAVKAIASQLAFNAEMKTAEKFSWVEFVGAAGWILEKCETVDAVPVRHGKWKPYRVRHSRSVKGGMYDKGLQCSLCNYKDGDEEYAHCP